VCEKCYSSINDGSRGVVLCKQTLLCCRLKMEKKNFTLQWRNYYRGVIEALESLPTLI